MRLFWRLRSFRNLRDFVGEAGGHLAIAVEFGDFRTFVQLPDRTRGFTFAEKYSNLAKDAGVELSFFGGIHGSAIQQRN